MVKTFTILNTLALMLFFTSVTSAQIFTEDFESGTPDPNWSVFYEGEEEISAVEMDSVPSPLPNGGNYVGYIEDKDGSYAGSSVVINGETSLMDYSIEADVYCYVNNPNGSAYTGLVVYADTAANDFYKLRADFDASDRINFSGLKSDTVTFLPLYSHNFSGADNPGLFPTSDGWHKMKVEAKNVNADSTAFWCYFDDQLLTGCPIYDTNATRNLSGSFGLYSFQFNFYGGLPSYFDNIVVSSLATSVDDKNYTSLPEGFNLEQNYPNPFNPETQISYQLSSSGYVSITVHDLLGREVKTLVSEELPSGNYTVSWNGRDESGNIVPSGIYFYTLKAGSFTESKKMILMK